MNAEELEIIEIDHIDLIFNNKIQSISSEAQEEIDLQWKTINNCFNGEVWHVEKLIFKCDRLIIKGCIGYYKNFLGGKGPNSIFEINTSNDCCIPLSVGAIVVTFDNKIVVAQRKGTHLNNNKWSFPAEGYMGPGKMILENIKDEMREELCVTNCNGFYVMGIVFDRKVKQPYVCIVWKTRLKSEEVLNAFQETDKKEFEHISFIDNNIHSIMRFCSTHDLTPHNLGKAYLYCNQLKPECCFTTFQ